MVNIILSYYMWESKFSDSAVTFLQQLRAQLEFSLRLP